MNGVTRGDSAGNSFDRSPVMTGCTMLHVEIADTGTAATALQALRELDTMEVMT